MICSRLALGESPVCEDLDECQEDNGGCEQDCVNNPGSFTSDITHQFILDDKIFLFTVVFTRNITRIPQSQPLGTELYKFWS